MFIVFDELDAFVLVLGLLPDVTLLFKGDGTVSPYSTIPWGFLVNVTCDGICPLFSLGPTVFLGEYMPLAPIELAEL